MLHEPTTLIKSQNREGGVAVGCCLLDSHTVTREKRRVTLPCASGVIKQNDGIEAIAERALFSESRVTKYNIIQ